MFWAYACGDACAYAHTCRGQRKSQQPACLLYLLILLLKWPSLIAVAISDSIQGNTLEFPLVLFSVSTVYIWHWHLSRKSAWTLDALVDTFAFSPIANLVLCYISIFCLSLIFCLAHSCQGGHSTCGHPSVQLTCCCKHSLHIFSPCLLFSLPRSFSCLLGECTPLDSGRAISSGSLPLATGKLLNI